MHHTQTRPPTATITPLSHHYHYHSNPLLPIGLRPFGVSFLYAGWDDHYGFQLYHSDPSGNFFGWKAHCIGANNASAQGILKQDYKEEITLKEATALAMKVLGKTMETTSLSSDKCMFRGGCCRVLYIFSPRIFCFPLVFTVEMATVTLVDGPDGKVVQFKMLPVAEVDALIKEHQAEVAAKKEETTATTTAN